MWRQSSKIPAAQECEKNVDFQGYDQTWEKQVERSGVAALGSDQDSFIGIFPLIILVHKQTFKVFFCIFPGWLVFRFESILTLLCSAPAQVQMVPSNKNDLQTFLPPNGPNYRRSG